MTEPEKPGHAWWSEERPGPLQCATCEAARNGPYCAHCGARHTDKRLTVLGLLRELPARFLSLERGFVKTFVDLSLRPGHVALDFVRGRRRNYVNPLPYFVVAATVQLLALISLRTMMVEQIALSLTPTIEQQPEFWERILKHLGPEPIVRLSEIFVDLSRTFYSYLWVVFCIGFALAFRMMPFAGERRFNVAEWMVMSLYSIGHIVMVTGFVNPLFARLLGFDIWTRIIWVTYLAYLSWAAIQFVRGRWYTVLCTAVALLVALMVYTVVFWSVFGINLFYIIRTGGAG